jgi:glycosyltransferase involved in cell wall biosynthesis
MRLWLFTTEFPPYYGGGIATYCNITTDSWIRHGHQVTVFVRDDTLDRPMKEETFGRLRVIRFTNHDDDAPATLAGEPRLGYYYAKWAELLIRKEGPPDLIESQDYLGIAWLVLQRKHALDPIFMRIPVVITAHNPRFILDPIEHDAVYKLPNYWTGELEQYCLRAANLVISPSRFLADRLQAQLPGLKVDVIPNPFPVSDPQPSGDRNQLVYFGRLQYWKGIFVLLDAMAQLWNQDIETPIEIYGRDTWFSGRGVMVTTLIAERYGAYDQRGLLHVHDPLPPQEVNKQLATAKIVVLPSVFENYPYVVLEALSKGCVVIASDQGGQREIIESGHNGFLFESQNSADLAAKVKAALALSNDDCERIAREAYQSVLKTCDRDIIYQKKMSRFESVIQNNLPRHEYPFVRCVNPMPYHTPEAHDPLLSVVIPFHNLGTYVPDTLRSLNAVTVQNIEIILVDDGSTDPSSIAALYTMQERYPALRVERTPNQGLALTRNHGAKIARGTYLAFLDADDMVQPAYYERAIALLNQYSNVAFVGCWTQYFESSDALWVTFNPEPPYVYYHNLVNSSALVYRRQAFLDSGLNDPDFKFGMEDYESVIRMVSHGGYGIIIPEPWFLYRVRPGSMSRAFNPINLEFSYRLIMEKNPGPYQRYAFHLLNLMNTNGPQYAVESPAGP